MKRGHLGWPPTSSAKHATANAAGITLAIAASNRTAPRRCDAKPHGDRQVTGGGGCANCGARAGEACRQRSAN